VIEQLLPSMDHVIIGGALANNFFKERGIDVGHSLIDTNAHLGDLIHNPKIIISDQLVWQESRIVDILISEEIRTLIAQAQTIIWNGPMGNYENSFIQGTKDIAEAIAQTQTVSIIGGGDSVALIQQLGMSEKFTFLSTGGGAMLEYLAQGTLPGIEALK
jgi:phosphoglycerate kinase